MRTYASTTEHTINAVRELPVVIPERGAIPGFIFHETPESDEAIWDDSQHFPMGVSFLSLGVSGVASFAEEKAKTAADADSRELYTGVAQVYREVQEYLKKYLPELNRRINDAVCENNFEEEKRLRVMLEDVEEISVGAPKRFRSAVTLFFIMFRIRNFFRTSCIGRLDVYLRSFFEKDIADGIIDEDSALEIILDLWRRFGECGSGDTLMNVMVGGRDVDGEDESSRLSVLMLRASILSSGSEPHINVRYHKGIRKDVMEEAIKLILTGRGQASVYNDEAIIPALTNDGIPLKYACRYANDGCTEIVYDGLSKIDFNHVDVVACVDLTLGNGKFTEKKDAPIRYYCASTAPRVCEPDALAGIESGNIEECSDFNEVYEAFLRQYGAQLDRLMDEMHEKAVKSGTYPAVCGNPFLNGTFDSVLESGKNMYGGGLPVGGWMTFCGSIPTAADCLIGVKHAVFEKKLCTLSELKKALSDNFEGHEELRAALLSAPKFGNDEDEVDLLAADIANFACDKFEAYRKKTGFRIAPALVGWKFLDEAYAIGASPDGRRQGEPIAEHYCATPGRAKSGPTAALVSISKGPLSRATGVAAAHLSLPSSVRESDDGGYSTVSALVRSAAELGLPMINIAIYDVDAMREAQKRPEEYGDLIVRVWGFSARFVDLCPEMQEHIIRRVE